MVLGDGGKRALHAASRAFSLVYMSIVLIGAAGAGKSAVGQLLAPLLERNFVDADEVAAPLYAEVGWSVERLLVLSTAIGYEKAHAAWEEALTHAVERLVEMYPGSVMALGAGHSHVTSPSLFARVQTALSATEAVILLRPSPDLENAIEVLRQRCIASKGYDWRGDGVDWLARWTTDGRDELLAWPVLYNGQEAPTETARRLHAMLEDKTSPDKVSGKAG